MATFILRNTSVEAEQFIPDRHPWPVGVSAHPDYPNQYSLRDHVDARISYQLLPGDWIITNHDGDRYPAPDEQFTNTYRLTGGEFNPTDITTLIKGLPDGAAGGISDGYHTFNELYEHRCMLWMLLCITAAQKASVHVTVWASKKHSDGSEWPGWFILGIGTEPGQQITYHLPDKWWLGILATPGMEILEQAPDFDDHTSADVLKRLFELVI